MLNRQLKILLYSSNIWYLGEGMFAPLFAVFAKKVGGDILEISGVWAAYLIASGIFTVFVGKIADKVISKEKLMTIGYALNAIFTFAYLLVSSQSELLVVQIGVGVASALSTPTWNALYAKYERYENHGRKKKSSGCVWALADGQSEIVTGIGVLLGGLIVSSFSFNSLFIVMGIVQTIATVYVAQILYERSPKIYLSNSSEQSDMEGRKRLLTSGTKSADVRQ
ncbi:Major Facilitator Superfamily transporter [Pleurocapsa sp. PCC 7327]|uniref:MFS transporter n=1 Tax=Pleurocapsa sp. PCC 7327 TaxID=118163 RepID=UPI00029FA6DF|nr:MFS transporter [Pleurocapsa sp. PCC 7327]AFY76444.1 Major Facilitator Superfamily transporter [Pleurocapsa sp. PCC 7327]